MTNQNSTSQNPSSRRNQPPLNLEAVSKLVEASPFRALLKLPPEEVLDLFHSRAGQALLEGLAEWRRHELEGLPSVARHMEHEDAVDRFYVATGVDEVCSKVLQLPLEIKRYLDATKAGGK